jgi:hypothetical protein
MKNSNAEILARRHGAEAKPATAESEADPANPNRRTRMAKRPKNIEWIVTGRAVLDGATCIVHAETRHEAIAKATKGENIGDVEFECASVADFEARRAEPNTRDD